MTGRLDEEDDDAPMADANLSMLSRSEVFEVFLDLPVSSFLEGPMMRYNRIEFALNDVVGFLFRKGFLFEILLELLFGRLTRPMNLTLMTFSQFEPPFIYSRFFTKANKSET